MFRNAYSRQPIARRASLSSELLRHVRLLPAFWRYSLRREIEFRASFLLYSSTYLIFDGLSLLMTAFVFGRTPRIGGWTLPEAWLVMATALLVQNVVHAFFYKNFATLVQAIPRGELDFVLIKPVSAQLYVSVRFVQFHHLPAAGFSLGAIGYGISLLPQGPTSAQFGLYTALALCGIVVCYALWFLLVTTALHVDRFLNVHEFLEPALQFARIPTDVMVAPVRYFFTLVIPLAFTATVPVKALLGTATVAEALAGFLLAPVLLSLSHWFWQHSLRKYVSASS